MEDLAKISPLFHVDPFGLLEAEGRELKIPLYITGSIAKIQNLSDYQILNHVLFKDVPINWHTFRPLKTHP
jgi:hypothetical protein